MPKPLCQECGRPVTFNRRIPNKARGTALKAPGRNARQDHDLCTRCWQSFLESRIQGIEANDN